MLKDHMWYGPDTVVAFSGLGLAQSFMISPQIKLLAKNMYGLSLSQVYPKQIRYSSWKEIKCFPLVTIAQKFRKAVCFVSSKFL